MTFPSHPVCGLQLSRHSSLHEARGRAAKHARKIIDAIIDIKPTIGEYQSVVRNIRREEVVLARLRLGHTRVTHSYLLQGEEHPQCVGCDAPFTVRHFLLECGDFAQVRNNCFHVNNMKELFQDIHIDSIMTFLRQINLFNKI